VVTWVCLAPWHQPVTWVYRALQLLQQGILDHGAAALGLQCLMALQLVILACHPQEEPSMFASH